MSMQECYVSPCWGKFLAAPTSGAGLVWQEGIASQSFGETSSRQNLNFLRESRKLGLTGRCKIRTDDERDSTRKTILIVSDWIRIRFFEFRILNRILNWLTDNWSLVSVKPVGVFFKGQPWPLLSFIFGLFKQILLQFLQQIYVKKFTTLTK